MCLRCSTPVFLIPTAIASHDDAAQGRFGLKPVIQGISEGPIAELKGDVRGKMGVDYGVFESAEHDSGPLGAHSGKGYKHKNIKQKARRQGFHSVPTCFSTIFMKCFDNTASKTHPLSI